MTADEHYFTAAPGGPAAERQVTVRLAGREVTVTTAGGVFSGDGLDLGTRVLLREVPDPPEANVLDLGCGWGPVALDAALRTPGARVWAVDVNERAVDLTRRNAAGLRLRSVTACRPDDVPEHLRFAAIWSNPPIRVGKDALHALLLRWLPRLTEDGEAFLVVQRNLGADSLQRWLAEHLPTGGTPGGGSSAGRSTSGWSVTRHGSAKGFRVLRVRRSGADPTGAPQAEPARDGARRGPARA